jgi:hypothetical protein
MASRTAYSNRVSPALDQPPAALGLGLGLGDVDRGSERRRAELWGGGCALGLAAGLAAAAWAPCVVPAWQVRTTAARLRPAALAAGAAAAPALDPRAAILLLRADPLLRAQRTLYDAALLRPQRAPLAALPPGLTASLAIRTAVARLDLLLAADPAPRARPGAAPAPGADRVVSAIETAADLAGVDRGFLARMAERESGLNPYAFARTSTARGPFQFVSRTWLAAVARWGAKYGLAREAAAIRIGPAGRPYVVDPAMEPKILALRYDPDLAARLAAECAAENATILGSQLGRAPSARELYAAHLLGVNGAVRVIRAAAARPALAAAALLPAAATANPRLFYRPGGAPRSVSELLEALS